MEYATSLIKRRPGEKVGMGEEETEEIEENWTFIGDGEEESGVVGRVRSLDGTDARVSGRGLDEVVTARGDPGEESADADLERRIEREMEGLAEEKGKAKERASAVKREVRGQAKVW